MGALYGGHDLTDAEIHRRADEALDRVGLSHRAHATPSTLSGGERQRVAIARALMMRPRLLLCDEPTGNLDSHTTDEILSVFRALNEAGQTLVMITHAPEVAAHAGRLLQVRDGVVREGRP
ncbi:MAG TPA: ATP-binding cassette domain-containing protein, partial [Arachnia sp.]|nr:ATP-binding cassette domain-containing protein [Arachnia sp.]